MACAQFASDLFWSPVWSDEDRKVSIHLEGGYTLVLSATVTPRSPYKVRFTRTHSRQQSF